MTRKVSLYALGFAAYVVASLFIMALIIYPSSLFPRPGCDVARSPIPISMFSGQREVVFEVGNASGTQKQSILNLTYELAANNTDAGVPRLTEGTILSVGRMADLGIEGNISFHDLGEPGVLTSGDFFVVVRDVFPGNLQLRLYDLSGSAVAWSYVKTC